MKAGNPTHNKTQKKITKIENKIMMLETKYQKKENKYDEFKEKHRSKALEERLLGEELDRLEKAGKEANKKQIDKLQKKYDKLGSITSKAQLKLKKADDELDDITFEIESLKDEIKELQGIVTSRSTQRLSEEDIDDLIERYNITSEVDIIKEKLRNLKYDNKYKSCFTGEKFRNLYELADDKLACYGKYSDEL
jgi:chromosome segregation ATPase